MTLGILTNTSSMSATRALHNASKELETSMERLSTGKQINRAGDDAAGLAIAQRMEAQIRGLDTAVKNANDGMAMTKSIEGALQEVSSMLQRMRELAVQAVNGTNTGNDRVALNDEMSALKAEIQRIADTTTYNGNKVLDGSFNAALQVGTKAAETVSVSVDSIATSALGSFVAAGEALANATTAASAAAGNTIDAAEITTIVGNGVSKSFTPTDEDSAKTVAAAINVETGNTGVTASAKTFARMKFDTARTDHQLTINGTQTTAVTVGPNSVTAMVDAINDIAGTTGVTATAEGNTAIILSDVDGDDITIENNSAATDISVNRLDHDGTTESTDVNLGAGTALHATRVMGTIQLSSSSSFSVSVAGTATDGYISTTVAVSGIDSASVTTATNASNALNIIDGAIEKVASMRSGLGAIDNRLLHSVSNLMAVSDNTSAAKSLLEDADYSAESANLAKAQVLMQAGTAMLAQANASPQLVLQLIQ
jgi:flagellin